MFAFFKRFDLAIINRSFWPENQIKGEAYLQLGERASLEANVVIITQSKNNLRKIVNNFQRGKKLTFYFCKGRSVSSSKLSFRLVDTVIFTIWVLFSLLITRPKKIYVSTNPPLAVPFVVFLYSKIFRSPYVYSVQDIHPEITNVVVKFNPLIFSLLKKADSLVMRHASSIITITQTMKNEIISRSNAKSQIYLIDNPTVSINNSEYLKIKGFVFSGNLGRVQQIPLLLESIDKYKAKGGKLPFLFIGEGIYSNKANILANKYDDVSYIGFTEAKKANELTSRYEWALLPIDDEVTKYAFPSKTSAYLSCGLKILSICSNETSVAKWVLNNNYGINSLPDIEKLVDVFFQIENGLIVNNPVVNKNYFTINNYAENIYNILFKTVKTKSL
jgi:glycosyltransferase involved in cell wall biosynthesis